jgi:hypothetical protein
MKRSSYLKYDEVVELGKRGLKIWAYGKTRRFVCRLEINATGVAVFSGVKGKKRIANMGWEGFVERLSS